MSSEFERECIKVFTDQCECDRNYTSWIVAQYRPHVVSLGKRLLQGFFWKFYILYCARKYRIY